MLIPLRDISNICLPALDDRYTNVGPFRDACLPVGLMDPAAFHQVLSNALLNISGRRTENNFPETCDSRRHHALAVTLINEPFLISILQLQMDLLKL
jgi:hypothetical protein